LVRSPYARDFVYRWQNRRGFGRLTMTALHLDEEWFCRSAWRRIAGAPHQPDVVHAHALHQAARLRIGAIPVVINLPGPPNPRYAADLRLADALVADGWAAANLPATLGTPVDRLPKGVDADRFHPEGPSARARLGLEGKRVVLTVARLVQSRTSSGCSTPWRWCARGLQTRTWSSSAMDPKPLRCASAPPRSASRTP
jgi:glycosyltransferase involved in cell wall biosynthesis